MAQWRYKAIEPIGQSKSDADILNELHYRVKSLYLKGGGKFADPIVNLTWDYGEKDASGKVKHLDVQKVAGEINGYYTEDVYDQTANPPKLVGKKGDLVTNFVSLRDDGTTSSGNWLYCGSLAQKDSKIVNQMERRGKEDATGLGLYPNWAWAWPVNRRVIYNRASVDPNGNPWDPKRAVLKWNAMLNDAGKPIGWQATYPMDRRRRSPSRRKASCPSS